MPGKLFRDLKQQGDAEAETAQAATLWTDLVGRFPAVPDYRSGFGKALDGLAWLARDRGELEKARQMFVQAIAQHREA